jgi:hypothetical protein
VTLKCLSSGYRSVVTITRDATEPCSKTLYNGIKLPPEWPPAYEVSAETESDVMSVPYLQNPPDIIPIDIGRQLFVDDFLIEETTLKRTYHRAEYHPSSPVLEPDRRWETRTQHRGYPAPTAMVYSDGVWYDPADSTFKMWYMSGYNKATAYAESRDGVTWSKPELDVIPGTNLVYANTTVTRGSNTIWLDHGDPPSRRFKMFQPVVSRKRHYRFGIFVSGDGIHWEDSIAVTPPFSGDRSTVFYNPFRGVWVFSIKQNLFGRRRKYAEVEDLSMVGGAWVDGDELPVWVGADRLDDPHRDLPNQRRRELYNLDANAYESLLLGLFTIYPGVPEDRPKINQVFLGFSRDGFHWDRPDRRPFIPVSDRQGDWNWGNVQSAGGCCLVVGDRLYFYMSGRAGIPGTSQSGRCSVGLATLRRDGFASMDAGDSEGELLTRPVSFSGSHAFVNLNAPRGSLRVEIQDEDGKPLDRFSLDRCHPLKTDSTIERVRWRGDPSLSDLAGGAVRFRFLLVQGSLYSFWVSPDESGASHGYVAAGGPGFDGPTDTVGNGAQADNSS